MANDNDDFEAAQKALKNSGSVEDVALGDVLSILYGMMVGMDKKLDTLQDGMDKKLDQLLDGMDKKIDQMDKKLDQMVVMDKKLDQVIDATPGAASIPTRCLSLAVKPRRDNCQGRFLLRAWTLVKTLKSNLTKQLLLSSTTLVSSLSTAMKRLRLIIRRGIRRRRMHQSRRS